MSGFVGAKILGESYLLIFIIFNMEERTVVVALIHG